MAEDIPATPGWVEERLDEIWARLYLPGSAPVMACRAAYLECLGSCGLGTTDAAVCHDNCRETILDCLHGARIASETIAGLGEELEALEAEITNRT